MKLGEKCSWDTGWSWCVHFDPPIEILTNLHCYLSHVLKTAVAKSNILQPNLTLSTIFTFH